MSSLKERLYNCEQTPPAKTWDQIAAALDASHIDDEFPSKLYQAEATPPAETWNRIAGALGPEQVTSVPINRNFSFLRYAAAAILIGLVAFGVIKWAGKNNSSTGNEDVATIDTTNKSINPDLSKKKEDVAPNRQPEPGLNDEPTNEIALTNAVKSSPAKKAKGSYAVSDDPEAIYAYNEHTPNLADRYIMYMTPDGGIVRMSKKWGNLVCCVSGQEQDPACKDQLKKWQEKLACAPVANGNFMDILSLVNTLNTDL